MANQFASISSAVALLKNWYQGPIVSQFSDELPLYREMERGKQKYNGLAVIRPVKVRRNPGIGATSDGGTLPAIGQQTTVQATINAKFNYLRFGITGPMIKASQGDKGAFVSAMEFEMSEGLTDLKNDVNRQLFYNGVGTIATVAAAAVNSNSITASGRSSGEPGNKYLDVGMVIDIVTTAGVKVASGIGITAISGTTTVTLTLSANVSCSATDLIVRSGAYNNEVEGLLAALDGGTGSIYGINRTTYPIYQGNAVSAGGGQLTLNLMQQAYNEARRRGNGKPNAVFCDFDSERFYNKLLVADKRYVGKVAGDGTFSSKDGSYLEFAGVPVTPDKDCGQAFFFIDAKYMEKFVLAELEWADETGSYLIAQTSADAFEARLRMFFNVFNAKPSASSVLSSYIAP